MKIYKIYNIYEINHFICIIVVRIKKKNDLLIDDIDNNLEPLKL